LVNVVEDGRAACEAHRWGDAWRLLANVDVDDLDVDDLDRFATAAYLTGHDEDGFALWTRAHQLCVAEGSVHRAAHISLKLCQGLGFKGDLPRFRGWVERSARLLEGADIDCIEQGYLEYGLGFLSVFEAGDIAGAHAHFVQAGKIGHRFNHRELITLARIGEGRMLVYLGDLAEGMARLDEAMVSIEAGELFPLSTGDAYCTVIDACAELLDLDRCRAWTTSFVRWCDTQQELVLYRGHCFLHRAEVVGMLGAWPDALAEALRACDRLAEPIHPSALGAACAIQGDLLRLLGDLEGADAAYQQAAGYGRDPQPGLARLRVDQGRTDAADASIRRALGEAQDPISRARLLDAFVEIVLAAGDVEAADRAAAELLDVATMIGTPLLRAQAARARGALLLATADTGAALTALRSGFRLFNDLGVRYEAARTRHLIAQACTALGDHDTAAMESAAADAVLHDLRSSVVGDAATLPGGLSARELQVLVLLASGRTNRAIAQDLVISEKTVASHVSHIFTKLDVTSRSAATAYAYDHGLVGTG
jgi:DNA-binding NarL/FixJ family response regulator